MQPGIFFRGQFLACKYHHRQVPGLSLFAKLLKHFEAAHIGKTKVEHRAVKLLLIDQSQGFFSGPQGFWAFLAGKMRRVIVEVRQLRIPAEFFAGNYEADPEFRKRFQDWVAGLWQDKDRRIAELLAQAGAA